MCPVPFRLQVWELCGEAERSLEACLGVGSRGFLQGRLLLAAKTLLLVWLLCDVSLKLFSSPVLASAPALPVTPMLRITLGNFESQAEVDSPKGASLLQRTDCLPWCPEVAFLYFLWLQWQAKCFFIWVFL